MAPSVEMSRSLRGGKTAGTGALGHSATTPEAEVARLEQALEDLAISGAASVSLVACPSAARQRSLSRELGARARDRGFVTAEVSLSDLGFDAPDALLRAILDRLEASDTERRGLLYVLEAYYDEHGEASASRFVSAAQNEGARGDLAALCRAYLATDDPRAAPETRAYKAWRDGREARGKAKNPDVRRALSERTAQRALGELTRILRALGYRGAVFLFVEGEALTERSERRREKAYTVLREAVDNFDEAGGAVASRLVIMGQAPLFEGARSLQSIPPLAMRLAIPSAAEPPPPHRSLVALDSAAAPRHRRHSEPPPTGRREQLSNLIRIAGGVPPAHGLGDMSVGVDRLERAIQRLFRVVRRSGGFFSVLVGDYGTGKTHYLLHLAERAREDRRPVFWLNLERANLDLGNPAAHLSRLLASSQIPLPDAPSALSLAARWTRSGRAVAELRDTLERVAGGEGEAAAGARKALRVAQAAASESRALEDYLAAVDLEERPGDAAYRRDAYRRLALWFELMGTLEAFRGPLLLIDEAENLYTTGRPPASRRTALRSLAFYCGGGLPGACVILALTPPAFAALKGEARALLAEAAELESTLEVENVDRFRRSLWGLRPEPVRALSRAEREDLCERVRRVHRSVRGRVSARGWPERAKALAAEHESPRTLIRAVIDELESAWWAG